YQKSLEESAARAEADAARAKAAVAEEKVKTVRETEAANRRKSIEVTMAEKAAAEAKLIAEAEKVRKAVEAEAQKLINEAENVLSDPARASLFRRKLLEHVEGIVAASVKPLEKIQDIRIMQLDGVTGGGGNRDGSPTDEVINSALRYRVQAPLIDSLLADIGIEGGGIAKQGGLIREASDMQRIADAVRKASGEDGGDGDAPKEEDTRSGGKGKK
ncbi:MAG: flotillin family protein, partial [Silicimonas sp.]|nr:flotillin family protein [Silicimonas sp.]